MIALHINTVYLRCTYSQRTFTKLYIYIYIRICEYRTVMFVLEELAIYEYSTPKRNAWCSFQAPKLIISRLKLAVLMSVVKKKKKNKKKLVCQCLPFTNINLISTINWIIFQFSPEQYHLDIILIMNLMKCVSRENVIKA